MSLAPVVLLHRHEAVVDSGKGVDVTERTRALDARPPFGSMGGAGNAGNALTPGQTSDNFANALFALPDDDDVHRALFQTLFRKERRVPAAPNDVKIGAAGLDSARNGQGVANGSAGEDPNAETKCVLSGLDDGVDRVLLKPSVHHYDLEPATVEGRAHRHHAEGHGMENARGVV